MTNNRTTLFTKLGSAILGAALKIAAFVVVFAVWILPSSAQPLPNTTPNWTLPQSLSELGQKVSVPSKLSPNDVRRRQLTLEFVCSPFIPRAFTTLFSYAADNLTAPEKVRLDISAISAAFNTGDYGMARLGDIKRIETDLDSGLNLELSRKDSFPVLLKTVRNNTVVSRISALPTVPELLTRSSFKNRSDVPNAQLEALNLDRKSGSLGQFILLYRTSLTKQSIQYETIVGVGMQPGLAYSVRLVLEDGSSALTLDEDIFLSPVCPADFMDKQVE